MVDDNFHYMDESERYFHGEFATCAEALAACRVIVDEYLLSAYKPDMTAIQLWSSYSNFGEDPFILTSDEQCRFSAWTYARERCDALCGQQGEVLP
jgi:hypothetical protein